MKRLIYLLVVCAGLASGCGNRYYARHILVPDKTVGNLASAFCGSDQHVLAQKRIDSTGRVRMADGAELAVWVIRGKQAQGRGTVAVLHGLGESKACYLPLGERLAGLGFDVVLIDLRGHGDSGGEYTTYGSLESRDVKAVLDNLLDAKSVHLPIYAFGPTLGGSAAIQYAAIDPRCKGVLALTPYKDLVSAGRRMLFPLAPTMSSSHYDQILAEAGKIARFDPAQASAVAAAPQVKCPLLLVHGWVDLSVPMEDSQEILKAAGGPKKLLDITPLLEQILLEVTRDQWVADRIDALAKEGIPKS